MKSAMDCREALAHAPLFVGEDLESDALEAVRGHLEACAECAAQVAALERALRAFEVERVRVDPRVDLWPNIERELAQSGHLRSAQPAATSPVAATTLAAGALSVGALTPVSQPAGAVLVGDGRTDQARTAVAAPQLRPHRTLAGARRWFAVAAAAALAVFTLDAWLAHESGRSGSPGGAAPLGPQVARSSQPSPAAPSVVSAGPGAAATSPSNAEAGGEPASGALAARVVANATSTGAPSSDPTPARYEGLRRVSGDEALLRDSLERWGVQDVPGGYSLVGYPIAR